LAAIQIGFKAKYVMQTINSYIYDNTVLVQVDTDPDIVQRNRVVYTQTLQLYKNSSNVVKVLVQNQDQKPVDCTGNVFYFQIIDDYAGANATAVFSSNVTFSNATTGTGYVVLTANNLAQLNNDVYTYSVYTSSIWGNLVTYVDDNYGAQGQLRLNNSAYPTVPPAALDLGQISDASVSAIDDFGTI